MSNFLVPKSSLFSKYLLNSNSKIKHKIGKSTLRNNIGRIFLRFGTSLNFPRAKRARMGAYRRVPVKQTFLYVIFIILPLDGG